MADISVEVVYALPDKQYLREVSLEEGATVEQAIQASGLLTLRKDIDLSSNKVGIFSRPVKLSDTLPIQKRCAGSGQSARQRKSKLKALKKALRRLFCCGSLSLQCR